MTDKILPCPFCGCEDIDESEWRDNTGASGPACPDCGAMATLEVWNQRAWQAARTVPEGFVMVPVEPTKGMVMAGYHPDFKYAQRVEMYKAMLSAAPEGKK